jgi:predicted helicase
MKGSRAKGFAARMADLARDVRSRMLDALARPGPARALQAALRKALGHELSAPQFADLVAQTVTYGLLTARVARPGGITDAHLASLAPVTSPFLNELLERFLALGTTEAGPAFEAVVTFLNAPGTGLEALFQADPPGDPVLQFFEDFLAAYAPAQRKRHGVFYTPQPVVSFLVRTTHDLLRSGFGLEEGLASTATWAEVAAGNPGLGVPAGTDPASPFVQILDPATGTGTFLVEVVEVIHRTLQDRWRAEGLDEALRLEAWNAYVPRHLLPRLHGFELMMAPYAVAHLKLGLKLVETGYRFQGQERARIYLTNALEPARRSRGSAPSALAQEAQEVDALKTRRRFTVILGNPPYSGISSNRSATANRLVDAYRTVDGVALQERKLWLQDDYVKFIRLGQTTLEAAGCGLLAFITNHGYLDNGTFRGMRQSLLGTFGHLALLDLHGNANRPGGAPGGAPDQNVFAIRQGVAMVFGTRGGRKTAVEHADLWGTRDAKCAWLAGHDLGQCGLAPVTPDAPFHFLRPQTTRHRAEYDRGWKLNELMPVHAAGIITARDHFVVALEPATLLERMAAFRAPGNTDAGLRAAYFAGRGSARYADGDTRSWKLPEARRRVAEDPQWRERVRPCSYRPFDERHVYWTAGMVDWTRPGVMGHMLGGPNLALHVCRQSVGAQWAHALVARGLIDDCYVSNKTKERGYVHPLYLHGSQGATPNFAPSFMAALGLPMGVAPEAIFHYLYAILFSPAYRSRYADFLKLDFPRVPLPGTLDLLLRLAELGGELVALHLLEVPGLEGSGPAYAGPDQPVVERVIWSGDTVWLAPGCGFHGVPEAVWTFQVGGYQVCRKWLKDRKGRVLSARERAQFQSIVAALAETRRVMARIDQLIEVQGGWPGAFAGWKQEAGP